MIVFILAGWVLYIAVSISYEITESEGWVYAINMLMIVFILLPPVILLFKALVHIIKTTKLSHVELRSDIKVMMLHFSSLFITVSLAIA
jgi:hypothetical protein